MQRLKTRAQFQSVLAGTVVARTPHFALHRNALDASAATSRDGQQVQPAMLFHRHDMWVGAMVPKRWAKRAVTRNAIKRQIYNVTAEFSRLYPQAAFVVRLRSSFARTEFVSATSEQLKQAVRNEVMALMQAGVKAA